MDLTHRRRLGRPAPGVLFDQAPSTWAGTRPPRNADQSRNAEYEAKWHALSEAATSVGWGPAQVAAAGVTALNDARAAAGQQRWALRTVAYYTKLSRYAGLSADHVAVADTEGDALASDIAATLWGPPRRYGHPAGLRSAAVAHLGWHWPGEVHQWLRLPTSAVTVASSSELRVEWSDDNGERRYVVRDADVVATWLTWERARAQVAAQSHWALCTTERGRSGADAGAQLSLRGFQAAFCVHVGRCGAVHPDGGPLSYDRYRKAAVANGASPTGARGAERATRRR